MLIIILRHVFNFISSFLLIIQLNDVEINFPSHEGTLGTSQISLVKNKKLHDKSRQGNKGKLPKSSRKVDRGKSKKVLQREGAISS